ncbi:hypothetical protein Hamer_G006429 [Homarus americanus]|uniref:Uncharacterized protein n=1 Tax=Homarus americanus TaxID=6706 RepID=A0A8J5JKF1_HOMAM|nr:hypothetical protein Hamer_G006429 [Homarus americanus]
METGVSQSEQRSEPMHKEDRVDIFPQVVAHEMKLRTFSGTPDNSDQINVPESAIYVDSGGTGQPPVGTGTKVEGEEVHQGGPLSSQEMESRPRECRKLLERREMANPCYGKPTSRGRTSGLVTQRVAGEDNETPCPTEEGADSPQVTEQLTWLPSISQEGLEQLQEQDSNISSCRKGLERQLGESELQQLRKGQDFNSLWKQRGRLLICNRLLFRK